MGRINKRDLISAVSKHSDIRRDVVEEVFNSLVDVSIQEIVKTGDFGIKDLFSISSAQWDGYIAGGGREVKPQKRLVIRLSEKVKSLWRIKNDELDGDDSYINADNWRTVFEHFSKSNKTDVKASKNAIKTEKYEYGFNPLLDEED